MGERAVAGFVRDGIDVRRVIRDRSQPSGVALIFVGKDGENSIAVASGANDQLSPADVKKAAPLLRESSIVLLQLETPLKTVQAVVQLAARAGVKILLNPAPARALPDDLLKHVYLLTPNETEAELLTGVRVGNQGAVSKAADALLARGIENVIITMGARGAFVAGPGVRKRIPAHEVKPVDATAAGDVFNGALAVALAEGKPLAEAAQFATAAAAISVTRLGAQTSAPTRQEIVRFLRSQAG
jgi:ribokinase